MLALPAVPAELVKHGMYARLLLSYSRGVRPADMNGWMEGRVPAAQYCTSACSAVHAAQIEHRARFFMQEPICR